MSIEKLLAIISKNDIYIIENKKCMKLMLIVGVLLLVGTAAMIFDLWIAVCLNSIAMILVIWMNLNRSKKCIKYDQYMRSTESDSETVRMLKERLFDFEKVLKVKNRKKFIKTLVFMYLSFLILTVVMISISFKFSGNIFIILLGLGIVSIVFFVALYHMKEMALGGCAEFDIFMRKNAKLVQEVLIEREVSDKEYNRIARM